MYDTIPTVVKGRSLARHHDLLFNLPPRLIFELGLSNMLRSIARSTKIKFQQVQLSPPLVPFSCLPVPSQPSMQRFISSLFIFKFSIYSYLDKQNTMFPLVGRTRKCTSSFNGRQMWGNGGSYAATIQTGRVRYVTGARGPAVHRYRLKTLIVLAVNVFAQASRLYSSS
jgi:hypothetical protein